MLLIIILFNIYSNNISYYKDLYCIAYISENNHLIEKIYNEIEDKNLYLNFDIDFKKLHENTKYYINFYKSINIDENKEIAYLYLNLILSGFRRNDNICYSKDIVVNDIAVNHKSKIESVLNDTEKVSNKDKFGLLVYANVLESAIKSYLILYSYLFDLNDYKEEAPSVKSIYDLFKNYIPADDNEKIIDAINLKDPRATYWEEAISNGIKIISNTKSSLVIEKVKELLEELNLYSYKVQLEFNNDKILSELDLLQNEAYIKYQLKYKETLSNGVGILLNTNTEAYKMKNINDYLHFKYKHTILDNNILKTLLIKSAKDLIALIFKQLNKLKIDIFEIKYNNKNKLSDEEFINLITYNPDIVGKVLSQNLNFINDSKLISSFDKYLNTIDKDAKNKRTLNAVLIWTSAIIAIIAIGVAILAFPGIGVITPKLALILGSIFSFFSIIESSYFYNKKNESLKSYELFKISFINNNLDSKYSYDLAIKKYEEFQEARFNFYLSAGGSVLSVISNYFDFMSFNNLVKLKKTDSFIRLINDKELVSKFSKIKSSLTEELFIKLAQTNEISELDDIVKQIKLINNNELVNIRTYDDLHNLIIKNIKKLPLAGANTSIRFLKTAENIDFAIKDSGLVIDYSKSGGGIIEFTDAESLYKALFKGEKIIDSKGIERSIEALDGSDILNNFKRLAREAKAGYNFKLDINYNYFLEFEDKVIKMFIKPILNNNKYNIYEISSELFKVSVRVPAFVEEPYEVLIAIEKLIKTIPKKFASKIHTIQFQSYSPYHNYFIGGYFDPNDSIILLNRLYSFKHELAHQIGFLIGNGRPKNWLKAIENDGGELYSYYVRTIKNRRISYTPKNNYRVEEINSLTNKNINMLEEMEDFAESLKDYLIEFERGTINNFRSLYPNRAKVLDEMFIISDSYTFNISKLDYINLSAFGVISGTTLYLMYEDDKEKK